MSHARTQHSRSYPHVQHWDELKGAVVCAQDGRPRGGGRMKISPHPVAILRSHDVAAAIRNPACQTRVSKFYSLGFLGEDADSTSEAGYIQGRHLEYRGDWKGANKAHWGFAKSTQKWTDWTIWAPKRIMNAMNKQPPKTPPKQIKHSCFQSKQDTEFIPFWKLTTIQHLSWLLMRKVIFVEEFWLMSAEWYLGNCHFGPQNGRMVVDDPWLWEQWVQGWCSALQWKALTDSCYSSLLTLGKGWQADTESFLKWCHRPHPRIRITSLGLYLATGNRRAHSMTQQELSLPVQNMSDWHQRIWFL